MTNIDELVDNEESGSALEQPSLYERASNVDMTRRSFFGAASVAFGSLFPESLEAAQGEGPKKDGKSQPQKKQSLVQIPPKGQFRIQDIQKFPSQMWDTLNIILSQT